LSPKKTGGGGRPKEWGGQTRNLVTGQKPTKKTVTQSGCKRQTKTGLVVVLIHHEQAKKKGEYNSKKNAHAVNPESRKKTTAKKAICHEILYHTAEKIRKRGSRGGGGVEKGFLQGGAGKVTPLDAGPPKKSKKTSAMKSQAEGGKQPL